MNFLRKRTIATGLGFFLIALSIALGIIKLFYPDITATPHMWWTIAGLFFLSGSSFLIGAYISRNAKYDPDDDL